jgi:hypothetical protein
VNYFRVFFFAPERNETEEELVVWKTGTTTLQAKRVFNEEHFWGAMPPCTSCYEGNIFHE